MDRVSDRTAKTSNPDEDGAPRLSVRDRIAVAQRALMRDRRVRYALEVMAGYGNAGGGLLAAGLAFYALFAIIPGILTLVALLGFVISDPASRENVVQWLVAQVPPVEPVARTILSTLADGSRLGSVVGIIGVIWGASGFYGALDGALSLILPGPGTRGVVDQRIRGVVGVLLIVGMGLVAVVISSLAEVVVSLVDVPGFDLLRLLSLALTCGIAIVVCEIVYVVVPRNAPSWRAALVPALVAGTGIGLLTSLFGLLTPFLIRGFLALGVIASVFAALVWFNLLFQIVLYGAAWARIRRDREVLRRAPPRI
jgi:membrane protein